MADLDSHSLEQVLHRTYGNSLVGHYIQIYIPAISSSVVEDRERRATKK